MSISANTLFHFTHTLKNLIGILNKEFKPHYHPEVSVNDFLLHDEDFSVGWAVPMVCFCDLPLSQVKEHMRKYGPYALGMSKEWGMRQGINPVLYVCNRSVLARELCLLNTKFSNRQFANLEAYLKPYEERIRRPRKRRKSKWYDEREWRYVPIAKKGDNISIYPAIYTNEKKLKDANERIGRDYKLSFEPVDIKYIIIKKDSQRLAIIEAIKEAKFKYPSDIVKELSSRIISSRQVREDF